VQKILGFCLVSAVLVSLVASSVASATRPVFIGVGPINGTPQDVKFEGTPESGIIFFESSSKVKIQCNNTGGKITGETNGDEATKNTVISFTNCESAGLPCESAGAAPKEIRTAPLEGALGQLAANTAGLRLFAPGEKFVEPKTGAVASFTCGAPIEWTGSIIGQVTPVGTTLPATIALKFKGTATVQQYTTFLAGKCGEQSVPAIKACGPEQLTEQPGSAAIAWGDDGLPAKFIFKIKSVPFASKLGIEIK
jgi:hypothetical protein